MRRERIRDMRGHAGDGDARYIINGRKYTPRRGGRFDPKHDRGESPESPGTRVFSLEIRTAKKQKQGRKGKKQAPPIQRGSG